MFSGGIHLLSAGSSDFVQNYYINPVLNRAYSPDQFSDILMRAYSNFVQVLLRTLHRNGNKHICGYILPSILMVKSRIMQK